MTVDELQLLITANTSQLQKEISKTQKVVNGLEKSINKSSNNVSSVFKSLKKGVVALGLGKVIKDSILTGMDAVESDSLFETSLGKWADNVRSWSEEVGNALGLNAVEMRKNTGVIYNMTTSMGLAENNALKMSKGITLLANDMASFYNLDTSEAFNKLRAGLTGETEPLKALGILVDENTIKQVAYSQGIAKNGEELTQQQKVLARYVAILLQTKNAQGDLARTLNSPANMVRQFKQQVQQLGLAFSDFLLPILSAVMPYLTAFTRVVTNAINSLSKFLGLKKTDATSNTQNIVDNIGGIGSGLDSANTKAKKLKNTLASFDEMNVLSDPNTDSSSGSSTGTSIGLDFDLSEYDAHLEWIDSKVDDIVKSIQSKFSSIGNFISKIWNSTPIQSFVNTANIYGQFLWDYWSTLGTNLYENIIFTWSNIESNLSLGFTNLTSLWTLFWTDLGSVIEEYSQPIIDGMSTLFNSVWLEAIDPLIQNLTQMWSDFTGILLKLWQDHGKPLLTNIGEFVTGTISLFQSIWDNVLEPIITPFLETMSWLWDKHIKNMIQTIGEFVLKLVNGALEIWNKFINPIIQFLLEKLAPAWSFLSSLVIGVLGSIVGFISDSVSAIFKLLGGIIDFLTGIFTLNWRKAWSGISSIFQSIWDGIVALFKFPINLIIDGLNAFISGLNKIKIPDWVPAVGGKGLNIPKIPKLAQGGIIDHPTVAMIGEAGKEAVLPLENNTSWMDKLASKIASLLGNSTGNSPIQLIVKIGDETLYDKVIDNINQKSFERNEGVILV